MGLWYDLSFLAGPAVYAQSGQATSASDGLLVQILRANDTPLAEFSYLPGAWSGTEHLNHASFSYLGDGSGAVRIQVAPLVFNTGRFAGAIDDIQVSASPVPEPGSLALLGTGVLFGLSRLRGRRAVSRAGIAKV